MISIILPAHNEEDRIGPCLFKIALWADRRPGNLFEVIVVENGSTDNTMAAALSASNMLNIPVHTLTIPEASKAVAVRTGMLAANGDILIMADVDLSTPPEEFRRFIDAILDGADVVIGSRRLAESHVTQSFKRRAVGYIFSVLTSFILPGIKDTQCGFKAFKRVPGRNLFTWMGTRSMAFDVELLLNARRNGYTITELPVLWKEDKDSRVRLFRDGARMAADIIRMMRWDRKPDKRYQAAQA